MWYANDRSKQKELYCKMSESMGTVRGQARVLEKEVYREVYRAIEKLEVALEGARANYESIYIEDVRDEIENEVDRLLLNEKYQDDEWMSYSHLTEKFHDTMYEAISDAENKHELNGVADFHEPNDGEYCANSMDLEMFHLLDHSMNSHEFVDFYAPSIPNTADMTVFSNEPEKYFSENFNRPLAMIDDDYAKDEEVIEYENYEDELNQFRDDVIPEIETIIEQVNSWSEAHSHISGVQDEIVGQASERFSEYVDQYEE